MAKLIILAMIIVPFLICQADNAAAAPETSILATFKAEFQKKNPKIEDISIIDVAQEYIGAPRYFVLARGIRKDKKFEGDFSDELFGLFVVDEKFLNILGTIAVIPTKRWNDHQMKIQKPIRDGIIITGQGTSYGDQPFSQKYRIPEWLLNKSAAAKTNGVLPIA